jgi:hypothetical protein
MIPQDSMVLIGILKAHNTNKTRLLKIFHFFILPDVTIMAMEGKKETIVQLSHKKSMTG